MLNSQGSRLWWMHHPSLHSRRALPPCLRNPKCPHVFATPNAGTVHTAQCGDQCEGEALLAIHIGCLLEAQSYCQGRQVPTTLSNGRAVLAPQNVPGPPNRLAGLHKRALNRLPNQPHAPVPPLHQPHTLCPLCKPNMCNSTNCAALVPRISLPFLWTPNNIRVT